MRALRKTDSVSTLKKPTELKAQGNVQNRVFKAFGATAFGQMVRLSNRLILPPLFIKHWGAGEYGEWLLLFSAVAYLSLSDFGARQYIGNRLVKALSLGKKREFLRLLHTSLLVTCISGLGITLVATAVLFKFTPAQVLNVQQTSKETAITVFLILGVWQVGVLFQTLLASVYRALGLAHIGVLVANLSEVFQIVAVTIGLITRLNLNGIAVCYLVPHTLMSLCSLLYLEKRFPDLRIRQFSHTNSKTVRNWISPSASFFLLNFAQVLSLQGVITVIGFTLNAKDVAIFTTIRTMANVITAVLGALAISSNQELLRLDAAKDVVNTARLFKFIQSVTLFGAATLVVLFHYFGSYLHRFWLGNGVAFDPMSLDLFLLFIFQSVFWSNYRELLVSVNRQKQISFSIFFSAVIGMCLASYWSKSWGVNGAIAGLIVGEICTTFWFVPSQAGSYVRTLGWKGASVELGANFLPLIAMFVHPVAAAFMLAFLGWRLQKPLRWFLGFQGSKRKSVRRA